MSREKGRAPMSAAPLSAIAVVFGCFIGSAQAYVGESYLKIPGVDGQWSGSSYKGWIQADAHYWQGQTNQLSAIARRSQAFYSGPSAPQGSGTLVIALDKNNPDLPQLMARCAQKTAIPELTYAESSDRARSAFEIGPRPKEIPEHFEYKLKQVRLSDCPVVPEAPQQAFVIEFASIERLNYALKDNYVELKLQPVRLAPSKAAGKSKTFVLTWFAVANHVKDGQCAVMNSKPLEADYYALMPKAAADKERAALSSKGGVNYENGQMGLRGPHKLNVTTLPGIVRDPGHAQPTIDLARGIDLDGNDGTGSAPPGTCAHKNYKAEDGRTGIDNQLYTVQGCIQGFQGHKGFILQFANNQMRDGQMSILLNIAGLDDERNEDEVEVTLAYSLDPMAKSGTGSEVLPDYTFRVTDKPEYAHYFSRMRGRIVNGVVTIDRLKEFEMFLGVFGTPKELKLSDAQLRLALLPDGTIKGVLGGYQDWRKIASTYTTSTSEMYHGFQQPALYNALKRAADGQKNPITGECDGISSAYDIEGIPAFIPPAQLDALLTQTQKRTQEKH